MNKITNTKITFLTDLPPRLVTYKSGKYLYQNLFSFEDKQIKYFIENLQDNTIFLIFPFITITKNANDPYLRLSNQYLVTKQSNSELIQNYLLDQWEYSEWNIGDTSQYYLFFKLKTKKK